MKKCKTRFICSTLATVMGVSILSVGMSTSADAGLLMNRGKTKTNVEATTESTTNEVTSVTYDGHIVNPRYNILNFIKENMPDVPELRFTGNTVEEYEKWRESTKEKLMEVMGVADLVPAESAPNLIESEEFPTYIRYKYEINTIDDLYMPYYVLKPKTNGNGKAAIALHGHGSDGKEGLVGNENESYTEGMQQYHYDYAFQLLEKGYTVYIPDLLGAGERTLGIYLNTTAECNDINNALTSLGYSLQGMILLENMRLADYIATLNYTEINCVGFSGGGQSALWLSVMDDNIDKTIVSGFLHSYKDTLIYNNRCGCNFVPDMWKYVDMGDILALCADKDIYIETGNEDQLNGDRGLEGVYEQIDIANKAFKLFDREVPLNVCDGAHQWYGSWMDEF